MSDLNFKIVEYSEKSIALCIDYDGVLTDELTDIGGKYNHCLKCGPGWIFPRKRSYEGLCGLLGAYGISYDIITLADVLKVSTPRPGKLPDYLITVTLELVKYAESINEPPEFVKNYPIVVRLTGGECVPIGKESLKTEFWFPDENHDEEIEKAQSEEYFISENCARYETILSALKGEKRYAWLANWTSDQSNRWTVDRSRICPECVAAEESLDWKEREMHKNGLYKKISEEDRQRLITGYEFAIMWTEKRCRTWLKRYGVGKLSVRTYWADR